MAEKIETILDYNPTEEEWKRFGGKSVFMRWFDLYTKSSPDNLNYHLGLLFSMRGNKEKANHYFSKIEDKDMLMTLWQDF